jgi:hypothetical protein
MHIEERPDVVSEVKSRGEEGRMTDFSASSVQLPRVLLPRSMVIIPNCPNDFEECIRSKIAVLIQP